jgi:tetratricopeptide (TPR) repeat protein
MATSRIELADRSHSRAILIGTAIYDDDQAFRLMPAAANSLRQVHETLTDASLCGWPEDQVTVIPDPIDVRKLVQTLRRLARATDDVLLVYFVGHGIILRRGQLCLVLKDTDAQDADITGLEYQRVREALIDSPAKVKVVILDCCYSGRAIEAAAPDEIASVTDTKGVYTLTASDAAAHVPPPELQATQPTSFTGEFLALIRAGIPAGPQTLTLTTLYPHLCRQLQRRGLPEPNQRAIDTAGDFSFALNVAYHAASPAPSPAAHGLGAEEFALPDRRGQDSPDNLRGQGLTAQPPRRDLADRPPVETPPAVFYGARDAEAADADLTALTQVLMPPSAHRPTTQQHDRAAAGQADPRESEYPPAAVAPWMAGVAAWRAGDLESAEQSIRSVAESAEDTRTLAAASIVLGLIRRDGFMDLGAASEHFSRAADAADPGLAALALLHLGTVQELLGNAREAQYDYARAAKGPDSECAAHAAVRLGWLLIAAGSTDEAMRIFRDGQNPRSYHCRHRVARPGPCRFLDAFRAGRGGSRPVCRGRRFGRCHRKRPCGPGTAPDLHGKRAHGRRSQLCEISRGQPCRRPAMAHRLERRAPCNRRRPDLRCIQVADVAPVRRRQVHLLCQQKRTRARHRVRERTTPEHGGANLPASCAAKSASIPDEHH